MKKNAVNSELLHLLVSIFNQSIQTYFYFPEVIICGRQHLEREEFDQLVSQDLVQPYAADSFGRYYRLSKKGEDFLLHSLSRRRQKYCAPELPVTQRRLPFLESC